MSKAKHTNNENSIREAYRYLANAKDTLGKSPVEYGRYTDRKYVSEAAGIAYLAALRAIDAYLLNKGIHHDKLPKSIEGYWMAIDKHIPLNGKLKASFNIAYEVLHLSAYYRGLTSINVVKEGLQNVKKIIDMLNKLTPETCLPASKAGNSESIVCEPEVTYKKRKKISKQ